MTDAVALTAEQRQALEALMPPVTITDGKLTWVEAPRDSTAEHDVYVMRHIRASGLDQIRFESPTGELTDAEAMATMGQMLAQVLESGRFFELLAGLVVQSGEEWSPEGAAQNVLLLKRVRNPDAKSKMHEGMGRLLLSFYLAAVASTVTSEKSSEAANPATTPVANREPEPLSTDEALST